MGNHWNRYVAGLGVAPSLLYGTDCVAQARLPKTCRNRHSRCPPRHKPAKSGQMPADRINEPYARRHHLIASAGNKPGDLLLSLSGHRRHALEKRSAMSNAIVISFNSCPFSGGAATPTLWDVNAAGGRARISGFGYAQAMPVRQLMAKRRT